MAKNRPHVPIGAHVSVLAVEASVGRHHAIRGRDGYFYSWTNDGNIRRDSPGSFVKRAGFRVVAEPGDIAHRDAILARLESADITLAYDLLRWNCEHFATWCFEGVARSGQVSLTGGGIVIGAAVIYGRTKNFWLALAFGAAGLYLCYCGLPREQPGGLATA